MLQITARMTSLPSQSSLNAHIFDGVALAPYDHRVTQSRDLPKCPQNASESSLRLLRRFQGTDFNLEHLTTNV